MTLQVSIQAPAKLNLGLEVVGRRADGFHDIVTIFQAISLCDELALTPNSSPIRGRGEPVSLENHALEGGIRLTSSDPTLDGERNLVVLALNQLRQAMNATLGVHATLTKRIPIAAGLGGASTDAAAALVAGRAFWQAALSDQRLAELARDLGSDVPFFLAAGTALGTGRGDQLTRLAPLTDVWFVVVTPAIVIPRKTPTLYGLLRPSDFSTGESVRRWADLMSAASEANPIPLPPNAFSRPLYALRPELAALPERMAAAGATTIGLSGAGPSHFALFFDPERAERVASRLRTDLGAAAAVVVATPVVKPPAAVSTYLGQG
ncbi:MAG: 4-(cytidine 5'-diphospho)-2-C-methyl-D-erythritol kinase [Chloroflexota bacterium]|nr:4-(cytidine 5'-diphospho)-2-C-methyl-D-erythritol kinase [Chloroflexota bacterium]